MVSREVTHFWFTGWPDHGVPSAQSALEFLLHVQKHTSVDMPGPIVVHCRYALSVLYSALSIGLLFAVQG